MPAIDGRELAAIFAGGAVGALLRIGVVELLPPEPGHWPWATLIVNLAGAVLLAYAATRLQERLPLTAYRRPFVATGVCGALTTFSTMQLELVHMLDRDALGLAAAYAAVSLALGFGVVLAVTKAVRRVRPLA